MSSCIYTDINESRQNLYLKLITIIYNLFDDNTAEDQNNKLRPVISHNLYNDGKSLNNCNNSDFFPIAFPILFVYKNDGHIAP